MAFDPDQYLATTGGGFNPDAYLGVAEEEQPAWKNLAKVPGEMLGFLEAPLSMGTGIVASALGGWRGILGGGAEGVQETQEALTYQPRTGVGKAIVQGVSAPFEALNEGVGKVGQAIGGDAGEAIGKSIVPVVGTLYGGATTAAAARSAAIKRASAAASKQVENLQQATTQAKYQAAKDLMDMGGVVNPADVNTSSSVQLAGRFANAEKLREAAAERNAPVVVKAIKKELGIADDMALDAKTLEAVRSKAAEANEAIRAIGSITDDGGALNAILPNRNVIGQSVGAKKIANLIDETTAKLQNGISGSDALESIRTLRADSRATFNRTDLKPKDRRVAEAQRKVADVLEGLIERNLADPALINKYRAGRELQAKTYVVEDILTPSGAVNLQNLLKGAPAKAKLTGELAKLKNIAAQFPSTTGIIAPEIASTPTALYRTGPGGTAGAAIGAPFGAPVSTGIAGTLAELVGAGMKRKQMLSPKYQAKNVLPEVTELVSPIPGAVPPAPTSRRIPINKDIPYSGLPPLNAPVVPGSWREGMQPRPESRGLPVLAEDLLPVVERYAGTNIPIGRVEAGVFNQNTPLPTLPTMERGLLSIADDASLVRTSATTGIDFPVQPRLRGLYERGSIPTPPSGGLSLEPKLEMPTVNMTQQGPAPQGRGLLSLADDAAPARPSTPVKTMDFPLRQEVLQRPEIVAPTQAFLSEAVRLRELITNSQGFWKQRYKDQLTALEKEFGAGMRQLGVDNPIDALGLKALYESAEKTKLEKTKLPIEKTFSGMLKP